MELKNSNVNFGMAFVSPTKKSMPYFRKYLANANKSGKIDTRALGEFIYKQSENNKVDLTFKHTKNGDVIEIFEAMKPENKKIIPIKEEIKIEKKNLIQKIKGLFSNKPDNIEYESVGSLDNLPKELKDAGELANKMEKTLL